MAGVNFSKRSQDPLSPHPLRPTIRRFRRPLRTPRSKFRRPIGTLIELSAIFLALGIWFLGGFQALEKWAYVALFNARYALFSDQEWDERIAVIAIDDLTLGTKDQFPLPRSHYADLLATLRPALPGAIAFDIIFVESSPDDDAFARAIGDSWNVVLAIAANPQGETLEIVPEFVANAAALGHVHVAPDLDGITRSFSLYQGDMPALGVAALKIYEQSLAATVGEPSEFSDIATPYHQMLPDTSEESQSWINWPAPIPKASTDCSQRPAPGDLHIYPFICVTQGAFPASEFANKIVLVGATAQGLDPLYLPFSQSRSVASIYLHAALIDNLLNDRLLQRIPPWAEQLLLLGLGLATVIGVKRLSLLGRVIVLVGFPSLWFLLAVVGLQASWWLPIAAPIGMMFLAFVGVQGREQFEKQQLMNLFQVYVSEETAQRIWIHRDHVLNREAVPVENGIATVLFVDIRDFTQVAEHLPPGQLMEWLNRYLSTMTDCITAHRGVVDKFIGDEIMAVFAPSDQTSEAIRQCALNAIAASFAMNRALQHLNQQYRAEELPTVEFGIGINTGSVAAGNVGGASRLNYSVVGDAVNVASRLQNINKVVADNNPHHILVTQETYDYVGDRYAGYPVGQTALKGRQKGVIVYSILRDAQTLA